MEGRQFLLMHFFLSAALQANQGQLEIEDLTANFYFFSPVLSLSVRYRLDDVSDTVILFLQVRYLF